MTRYVPDRSLPAQAYIPGKTPRPAPPPEVTPFDPAVWRTCDTYLYAFDLLAGGFPWEAHEAWESLWRTVDRGSAPGLLLQALIKLAAAKVKLLQAQSKGVSTHAASAAALLRTLAQQVAPERVLMGIDLERLAIRADALPGDAVGELHVELVGRQR